MWQYFVFTYLVAQLQGSCGTVVTYHETPEVDHNKNLVLAFLVNRHGERSPDADELSLSNIQDKIKNLTYIEGLEGLTNLGKRRAFQIGKFIRQRYGEQGHNVLSKIYLQDEIAVRSTDKERTKMTAMVAMTAAYPPQPEQQWDDGVGKVWQPVPYTAVPLTEDYLRYYSNCKKFTALIKQAKKDSINHEFKPYLDLVPKIKQETGKDFTENPTMFQTLFDLFKSQIALGLGVPDWAEPIMTKLSEAAKLAYKLYFRNDDMKKIGGGVMLSNFIEMSKDIIAGKEVNKRVRMFSAHDFNIGALMEVTKVVSNEEILPEYGSLFAIELYKDKTTGGYSVLPVYLPKAGESSAQYLHFKGCEHSNYCEFAKFKESTKQYILPEKDFYNVCSIKTELSV